MRALMLAALLAASAAAAKAPDFKVAKVLGAPVSKIGGLKDLKGKVVFVEFWATWCAPCVAGIPRMNKLIEAMTGESVVFLSITDEPAAKIEPFLKKYPMKAWVGLDVERSSLKAFRVKGRPSGYLIGKDGGLLAKVYPDALTEKDLRDALAGKYEAKPIEWDDERGPARASAGGALFRLSISSASAKNSYSSGDGELEGRGMGFQDAVGQIWDIEASQVVLDIPPPIYRFDFALKTSTAAFARGRLALQAAVEAAFGFRALRESREADVYLLTVSTGAGEAALVPAADGGFTGLRRWGWNGFSGKVGMSDVARALWSGARKPVFDETGLKGVYELDLKWKGGDEAERERALAAVGLSLLPARRPVEFVRVTSAPVAVAPERP